MPSFGEKSRSKLDTCHKDLQLIAERVIKIYDFSIIEGARSDQRQWELFISVPQRTKLDGKTKKSKHQVSKLEPKSKALDAAPYPIDFSEAHKAKARFYLLAGHFFQAAEDLYNEKKITHKIRWGGDWDSDKDINDQSFDDLPHFELVAVKSRTSR